MNHVCALLAGLLLALPALAAEGKPVPVRLDQGAEGWRLLRGGKPYFVRGAGGGGDLRLLASSGGNSVRTWGADEAGAVLDAAERQGLTVTVGIWLGHKEHGFRYDDPKSVAAQLEQARGYVEKYRDHPALLCWAVGNEMEGDGSDPNVWRAVQDIARMIKRADPAHPTLTVIAEIGGDGFKARRVAAYCPDIDILGVNSYGGLASLPARLKAAGWTKPYIVTEFGTNGPWEVGKTPWGAPLEPTSTEKARQYAANYAASIAGQPGWCLGAYVFLWGEKVEATPTWFGMFLHGGNERLGTVDAMQLAWSGRSPAHPVPTLTRVESAAAGKEIAARSAQSILLEATGDGPLTASYEIRPEQNAPDNHEPGQKATPAVAGVTPSAGVYQGAAPQSFTAPERPGAYRLFITLRDRHGGAATANVPFYVK